MKIYLKIICNHLNSEYHGIEGKDFTGDLCDNCFTKVKGLNFDEFFKDKDFINENYSDWFTNLSFDNFFKLNDFKRF